MANYANLAIIAVEDVDHAVVVFESVHDLFHVKREKARSEQSGRAKGVNPTPMSPCVIIMWPYGGACQTKRAY